MGKKSREKRLRTQSEQPGVAGASEGSSSFQLWESQPMTTGDWTLAFPQWVIPVGLFTFALAVRALLLAQVSRSPYLEVDNIDAKGYQEWAAQILGGAWLPHHHFYQSPLYAYYLACVYGLFGSGPWAPRVIQIVLGSASVVLLYFIGRRVFSSRVALIAALMLAIYGPMIVEEIMLAKTSLVVFSALAAVLLYVRAIARDELPTMLGAGVVFGLTIIGVGQWLVVWLLLAAYLMLLRLPLRRRAVLVSAMLVGGSMPIAPLAAWNSYWGGGLMLTSGDAGLNLFIGNNPLATGLPGRPSNLRDVPQFEEGDAKALAERDVGHALAPAAVSAYWSHRATQWAVENPSAFITTTMEKLVVLLNAYEMPDSYHYAFIRQFFIPAFWACLTFAVVGPLAIVGLVVVAGHKPARPIYIACIAYLAVIVLVYVRARYRIPAIPFLILFAAAVIDWGIVATRNRQWPALAITGVAMFAVAAFVNHQYCEPARGNFSAICLSGDTFYDLEWMKLAEWHRDHNDLAAERDNLEQAMKVSVPRGPGQLNFWFGYAEYRTAESLARSGQREAATAHYQVAEKAYQRDLARKYRVAEVNNNLALVYEGLGSSERALQTIDAARQAQPNDLDILKHGLRLHVAAGNCTEARRWLDQIEQRRPNDVDSEQLFSRCGSS